jgi:hypothetical protein
MLAGARDEGCLSDAGIYNWNIAADLITGDAAVAYLFGLDPDAAYQGLSMGRYLERIHEDDRSDVVEAIHTAVLCSGTLQMPNTDSRRGISGNHCLRPLLPR